MKKVVLEKFKQNTDCLEELLNTNNMELIEDTTGWHDNIWGECSCTECKEKEHKNLLGKILMEIREENNIKWNDKQLKKYYNDFMDKLIETAKTQATNAANTVN